jgi:hypothetical protein
MIYGCLKRGTKSADSICMSSILFNNLSSNVQSLFGASLQGIGSASTTSANTTGGIGSQRPDSSQLSPFAQLMSTLQQMQLSDPAKYQQVMQQIATNLQSAAQTATSQGNTTAATQLNQLSADFTNASQSGQLPNIQDLAQAIGGGHRHHHHHAAAASPGSDSTSSGSSSASSSSDSSQLLSQLQAAFQSNAAQSNSLNPMSIILNTLSGAGVTGSTGT